MTIYLRNLFLFISLASIFSCESVVKLDIEEDSHLVIQSLFTPGNINIDQNNLFEVRVSETVSVLEKNKLDYLTTAEVTIKPFDQELEVLSLLSLEIPSYKTRISGPEEGRSYELFVSNEGHESILAKSYVPFGVEIENMTFKNIDSYPHEFLPDETTNKFNIQFEIQDDIEENNFYHLLIWRVKESDLIGDNAKSTLYGVGFDEEKTKHDPSVQIVNSNVAFYGAYINDELFNGEKKKLDFDMVFTKWDTPWPENIKIEAELRTVSEEYFRFHTEGARYTNNGNNTFFNDQSLVSNNIENGYGIFAGYALRTNRQDLKEQ